MICRRFLLSVSGAGVFAARKAGAGIAACGAGETMAAGFVASASAWTAGVFTAVIMATSVPVAAPARMQIPRGVLMLVLRDFVLITIHQFY